MHVQSRDGALAFTYTPTCPCLHPHPCTHSPSFAHPFAPALTPTHPRTLAFTRTPICPCPHPHLYTHLPSSALLPAHPLTSTHPCPCLHPHTLLPSPSHPLTLDPQVNLYPHPFPQVCTHTGYGYGLLLGYPGVCLCGCLSSVACCAHLILTHDTCSMEG